MTNTGGEAAENTEQGANRIQFKSFEQAVKHAGHSIVVTDRDGTIEYVNPAFEEITGYTKEEVVGKTPRILKSGEHDDDFYRRLWETVLAGDVWHAELVNERKNGERFTVDQTIAPILDDSDTVERLVAVNRDITKRTKLERQLKQQRDRLDVLNQVVRHDVRNDLQLVVAYADMLEDHVDDTGRAYLDKVQTSAEDAVELTRTARELADVMLKPESNKMAVALDQAVEEQVEDIDSAHVDAEVRVSGSIPAVSVEADDMLPSVFRNLLQNAVRHNDKDVPKVSVSTATDEDCATVCVRDNGPGIPDSRKDEIFGKGEKGMESPGTGLGLYLVGMLVDQYDGSVEVHDAEPDGSVFEVTLPLA
ncbi:two-component system sensor histidine kinase NtrB [Haloferax profundi]|uniref:two-component system sensor histidine kinase NtrB n=1 Tax=Haloferax profundi TaxID=1544718 RepID=UPI000AC82613|nr:PAS domain-containing sensor histidine kinase [Haloferax profundi]